jgi:hypothetical protein
MTFGLRLHGWPLTVIGLVMLVDQATGSPSGRHRSTGTRPHAILIGLGH